MEYIYIGRISTTHGLKGEVKLRSNFKYKDQVFKPGVFLYIGKDKEERKIISYRPHKEYDMVILEGLDDIDKVIPYKGLLVYCNKEILDTGKDFLNEDLIGLDAYFNDKYLGKIDRIIDEGSGNDVIYIGKNLIPKNNNFIEKIDLENKKIYFKNIEGLIL